MQALGSFDTLVICQTGPVRASRPVFACSHPTGPGRHSVQDRSVERRVDDLVVGHVPLLFNTPNLNRALALDYVEKSEIVQ